MKSFRAPEPSELGRRSLGPASPGELWREALRAPGVLRRFGHHLRPRLWRMAWAALASLGFALVTLLEPWPLQVLFDGALLGRRVTLLGVDLLALAGGSVPVLVAGASLAVLLLALLGGILYYAQSVLSAATGQEVVTGVRRELFEHLMALPMSFHRRSQAGDILMRLTGDIVMLREATVAVLATLLPQSLVVLGMVVIMAGLSWKLTLVAGAVVPLLFVTAALFRVRLVQATRKQRKREGTLASTAQEVISGIQLVQACAAEASEAERFRGMNKRSLRAGLRTARLEAQLHRAVQISLAAGVCGVLWLGTRDVLGGSLSPGQLLVFLAYVRGLYKPMRQMSKMTQRMAKASVCAERVLKVLDEAPAIHDSPGAVDLRGVRGAISFRGVWFSYDGKEPVLRDVNVDVAPGEFVALVGASGAGKTTLLSLVPRFASPQQGEVLIDGLPVVGIRLRSLRRQISFALQESVIMGASIWENIAYGWSGEDAAPGREEVEGAARAARAHEFISRLRHGYNTVVGERGSTLSAGERQRIALARAFLRRAPILILDEPMTGLDPLSESELTKTLEEVARGRTTLVTAHRLGTVLRADRILFLEDGRIVEEGPHLTLLARGGAYARFFQLQWGSLAPGAPGAPQPVE